MNQILIFLNEVQTNIMDFFANAGAIANFCTVILFIFFIIGKIWVLARNRSLYSENFEYMIPSADDDFNKQFLLGEGEAIKISSPDGIYDIKVYEILSWDKKMRHIKERKMVSEEQEDNIYHPAKLNKGEPVYIRTDLPCGVPRYQVEIVKYDYVKFTALLGYNGKIGGLSLVDPRIKYGIRSLLYYLFL